MPVRGDTVLPSADSNLPEAHLDPAVEAVAIRILAELRVPHRVRFTPSQLAQDVGGTARSWQRACQLGDIEAVHLPGGWVVWWRGLVRFVAQRQNLIDMN